MPIPDEIRAIKNGIRNILQDGTISRAQKYRLLQDIYNKLGAITGMTGELSQRQDRPDSTLNTDITRTIGEFDDIGTS
jgi:hypothetical protein